MDPQLTEQLTRRRLILENLSGVSTLADKSFDRTDTHPASPRNISSQKRLDVVKDEEDFLKKIKIFESFSTSTCTATGTGCTNSTAAKGTANYNNNNNNSYYTGTGHRSNCIEVLQKLNKAIEESSASPPQQQQPPSSSLSLSKQQTAKPNDQTAAVASSENYFPGNKQNFHRKIKKFDFTSRGTGKCNEQQQPDPQTVVVDQPPVRNHSGSPKYRKSDYNNWELDSKWTYIGTEHGEIVSPKTLKPFASAKKSKGCGLVHNTIKLFSRR